MTPDPEALLFTLGNRFIKSAGHSGCAPRRVLENSLACGIMRIVIRARTHGSYAFNYSLGGFCQPTRGGLRCEPEWYGRYLADVGQMDRYRPQQRHHRQSVLVCRGGAIRRCCFRLIEILGLMRH
jgi:hypothetical protein